MTTSLANDMPETPSLSIGSVLNLLKPEFAEVSISKIRFLESEGLVTPHRTPSGYRQFSGRDVEQRHLDVLERVKQSVTVPVAVKLSPYFSSIGEVAVRLDRAGADALAQEVVHPAHPGSAGRALLQAAGSILRFGP